MMRQCGECTLCCKLLPVHDGVLINGKRMPGTLDKAAGERCPHQRHGKGCALYGQPAMPLCCSMWNCRWLVNDDTADLSRPDRSHLVIDISPDYVTLNDDINGHLQIEVVQVWCDPAYPDAHRSPQFRRYVERRAAEGKAVLVRFSSSKAITLFAPAMATDGQWHELTGAADAEHSVDQIIEAVGHG